MRTVILSINVTLDGMIEGSNGEGLLRALDREDTQGRVLEDPRAGGMEELEPGQGDIAEEIAELKRQPGKDILMFGGGSIASAFMKAGLIDVYRVTVYPVVLGDGKPLFQGPMNQIGRRLESEKTFASGAVGLRYRKAERPHGP
jgi:riboflavin biosynthesis pyrimidine reductase